MTTLIDEEHRLTALILLDAKARRDPNYDGLITAVRKRTGRTKKQVEQEIRDAAGVE